MATATARFHIIWKDGLRSESFDNICHLANAVEQVSSEELLLARLVMTTEFDESAWCSASFLFALAECSADGAECFRDDDDLFREICYLGDEDESDDGVEA